MGAERASLTPAAVLARFVGAFVDELVAAGVTDVCLCPGSRSTPLASIIHGHPRIKTWYHLDERSCAFFGLGMAKLSRRPVAIVCSSGTAAVNFAPAVYEAFNAQVPLIVLTADRPQDLRDVGATQTIDQIHLYGRSAKWFVDMLLPETSDEALRYVGMVAVRAVAKSLEPAPGPVHINFPLREPLQVAPPADASPAYARSASITSMAAALRPDPEELSLLVEELLGSPRGLIVCGPQDDPSLGRETMIVAELYGYPVLADVLSQVRCGPHFGPNLISAYDSFLRDGATVADLAPDFILRLGATPVSKPLSGYLQRYRDVPQLLVTPDSTWRDPDFAAGYVIAADARAFLSDLAAETQRQLFANGSIGHREARLDWLTAWQAAEKVTLSTLASVLRSDPVMNEPAAFSELAATLPANASVFAGNSMPVRDLDTFFPGSVAPVRFLANRGASGIDGVVSSALGAATRANGRLVLLIGDISFYHDMNGLLAAKRYGMDVTIVLLNNDGGGIFSFLPQHDDAEAFEDLFGTPHGLDFTPAAQLYGLPFETVDTPDAYRRALAASYERPGTSVIQVRTEREANLLLHQRLWREVASALHGQVTK